VVYVSITGLTLRSLIFVPEFWWHAIRSMAQARQATGILSVDAREISGVHHTLSVWENEAAMRRYLVSGAHLEAMRSFHRIATGKTVGYLADATPRWEDVHDIWRERGQSVGEK
jgi:hypothetical protein